MELILINILTAVFEPEMHSAVSLAVWLSYTNQKSEQSAKKRIVLEL
jgi:hypothetical protein